MNAQEQTGLVTVVILVIVVGRFLFRELRARTVRLSTLWMRPAFLAAVTAVLVWVSLQVSSPSSDLLVPSLVAGALAGIVVGVLVAASTRVEPAATPGAVRLHGSWVTVAIWLGALALRVLARYFIGGSALNPPPAVNSGTAMLVAVAFATFAVLISRRAQAVAAGVSGAG